MSRPASTFPSEAKAPHRSRLLVDARGRLQLGVVGRDAEPDEPPRRRQPLDHVHLDARVLGREQRSGRIEACRTRADDGDPQGATRAHGPILRACTRMGSALRGGSGRSLEQRFRCRRAPVGIPSMRTAPVPGQAAPGRRGRRGRAGSGPGRGGRRRARERSRTPASGRPLRRRALPLLRGRRRVRRAGRGGAERVLMERKDGLQPLAEPLRELRGRRRRARSAPSTRAAWSSRREYAAPGVCSIRRGARRPGQIRLLQVGRRRRTEDPTPSCRPRPTCARFRRASRCCRARPGARRGRHEPPAPARAPRSTPVWRRSPRG